MANTVKKHKFKDGGVLKLKKLSSGKYSLTMNGDRLEDPIPDWSEAKRVYKQAIKDIRRGRKSRGGSSGFGLF